MLLSLLLACVDSEPQFVSERDIDKAFGTGDTPSLCAGLRMEDPKTREAAARRLSEYGLDSSCLCERLTYEDRWDAAILGGLTKAKDVEKVGCVGTLLDAKDAPERPALAAALLKVPAVRPRVIEAAASDSDPAVRAAAMPVFRGTKDKAEVDRLAGWLTSDPNPAVRAAAASALFDQAGAADALRTAATSDAEPSVRAAALAVLPTAKPADLDDILCKALLDDPTPEVRLGALAAMKGTRDPEQLACLATRVEREESSPEVRAALLGLLAKNGDPKAAKILCDAAPGWIRMYVKDAPPSEGDDILKAQNDRDFEKSYDCGQAAQKAGGYTCQGKAYVATFFQSVGGKVGVPNCGGGKPSGSGGGGGEIVF